MHSHQNTMRLYHSCTLGRTDPRGFLSLILLSDATIHSYSPCALRSHPSVRKSNAMRLGLGFLFSVLSSSRESAFNLPFWLGPFIKIPASTILDLGFNLKASLYTRVTGCRYIIPYGTILYIKYHRCSYQCILSGYKKVKGWTSPHRCSAFEIHSVVDRRNVLLFERGGKRYFRNFIGWEYPEN